jgi:hypothetical protein
MQNEDFHQDSASYFKLFGILIYFLNDVSLCENQQMSRIFLIDGMKDQ